MKQMATAIPAHKFEYLLLADLSFLIRKRSQEHTGRFVQSAVPIAAHIHTIQFLSHSPLSVSQPLNIVNPRHSPVNLMHLNQISLPSRNGIPITLNTWDITWCPINLSMTVLCQSNDRSSARSRLSAIPCSAITSNNRSIRSSLRRSKN